jgi:hypothetical protein
VQIARDLYAEAPVEFLPRTLRPATKLNELSPADRVFGWAGQSGDGAVRGRIRIGTFTCETADAIEPLPDAGTSIDGSASGVPLAILGQPKPQQGRFYLGEVPEGRAQETGKDKGVTGYRNADAQRLRGRKIYQHHALAYTKHHYWNPARAAEDARKSDIRAVAKDETEDPTARVAEDLGEVSAPVFREWVRRRGYEQANRTRRDLPNRDNQKLSVLVKGRFRSMFGRP